MMSPRTQIHKSKLPNHSLANTVQEFVERHRPEDFPFWVLGCFQQLANKKKGTWVAPAPEWSRQHCAGKKVPRL